MRKETLTLYVDTPQARDNILAAFRDCISFATDREHIISSQREC